MQSQSVECLDLRRKILSRHDGPTDGYETLEVLAEIDPNFVVDWHIHPEIEAGYALEGGGELRVKGEATQIIKPGSTWVIAPVTPHTLHKPLATPVPAPA